jgi:hypothetical protein
MDGGTKMHVGVGKAVRDIETSILFTALGEFGTQSELRPFQPTG